MSWWVSVEEKTIHLMVVSKQRERGMGGIQEPLQGHTHMTEIPSTRFHLQSLQTSDQTLRIWANAGYLRVRPYDGVAA